MDHKDKGWIFLLIKSPVLALILVIVLIVGIIIMSTLGLVLSISQQSQSEEGLFPISCQQDNFNEELFYTQFQGAGAFDGMADAFIESARKYQIDPVLLSSIAFQETGRGSSKMVRDRNNPGGLYNSSAGSFFVFDSLEEGIDAMAKNLHKLYISKGLFTVEQIGAKYAPIGANNDPNNLNMHWVPRVNEFVASFGGLTMNCEAVGLEGGFVLPVSKMVITSKFGVRSDPFTGEIANHKGIDLDCEQGDPIFASLSGKVYASGFNNGGYGNHVVIQHGDKYTLYAHMSQLFVKAEEEVSAGTTIGACGTTGNSKGTHLHFEIQLSPYGVRIDPLPYIQGSASIE